MQVAEDMEVGDIYRYRRQLWYLVIGIVVCLFVGAIVMKFNEDWSWIEAFFFIIETSAVSLLWYAVCGMCLCGDICFTLHPRMYA